jgi:hypothetical protein
MNKHFDFIDASDWLTKQDRDDFARYCYIYSRHIGPQFGCFKWGHSSFTHFCKSHDIQQKGNKKGDKKENHFWFDASKPQNAKTNDFAHHFLRHIRNAFAHGNIQISYRGRRRQKYYILQDFDTTGHKSMSGCIRSDLLWEMIWLLFQTGYQQSTEI